MNATIQDTLLNLFHQVIEEPDRMPAVPFDSWQEGSEERQLLTGFRDMLECMRQSKRQAEEQLREKEEQYRSIFEATGDGLFVLDLDSFVVEANPAACRQLGYTYEEIIGLHRSAIVHPDYHSLVPEYFQVIQTGDQFQGRAVDVRKDGTTFPVEVLGKAFTYKGQPHTLSVVRDITKQVQAEEQLREREAQYRAVFEASTDALIICDQQGIVVEVNPAACSMSGEDYSEWIGINISYPQPSGAQLHLNRASVQARRQFLHVPGKIQHKDGTFIPVETYSIDFAYKGQPHILTVVRDITERVQAEQQLREREEQYRSIFEATNDAVFIMDLEDGHIVEANPAACNIYGYSYEEFIGLPPNAVIHPDQLPTFIEKGLPSIRAGGQRHIQGVNLRKDGSAFPIDLHQSVFTYQGKPHILSVMRDITEQVQAQQLLEQRVEERTRELSTLLEVSHNVASTLDLKSLLGLILEQLKVVADYDGATVTIVEGEHLVIIDYRGTGRESMLGWRFSLKRLDLIWEMIRRQEVVIVEDVHSDTPLALAYRQAVGDLRNSIFAPTRAWMAVPMMLKERVMGVLNLSSRESNAFTERQATLALGIANQAAIAIENARLYAQAQELAALEERQKLARELHDSVSQALYGISLGTHAARTALERDPEHVAEPLDYVLSLTEAALAEMRALIFELRPESLEKEGLVSALSKQAAALQARHELIVSTELCDEPDLPIPAKQELYRIAQEAMHNTVKHAHASQVVLHLEQIGDGVILEVRDNGGGFDTTASFPGHLGLHSMRERATKLGGTFEIESMPGAGTSLRAHVPVQATTE